MTLFSSSMAPQSLHRRYGIVALLALGMVIAYIDRANLSALLALGHHHHGLAFDDISRGWLNSAFFWSYALLQMPAGWIVDRYGPKLPYAVGFTVWSIASAAAGFVQNVSQLVGTRLVLGVGESVSTAASLRWIRTNCRETERGLATGILFAGTKVGAAIGVPLSVGLILHFSWRAMFVICGAGGLFWLIAWMVLVPQTAEHSNAIKLTAEAPRHSTRLLDLLKKPVLWGILLGTFAYNYYIYFCLTWLPAYFTEVRHLTPKAMGFLTMFGFGGMALVGIFGGWAADRMIAAGRNPVEVRRLFTLAGFVIASSELIGMLARSNEIALFFAVFSLAGLGLTTANYWALTQTLFSADIIGRMVGIQNFASNLSGIVAPVLTGWLKQRTGHFAAAGWAVLCVLLSGLAGYGLLVRANAQPEGLVALDSKKR